MSLQISLNDIEGAKAKAKETLKDEKACISYYSCMCSNQILPSKVASILAVGRGCCSTFIRLKLPLQKEKCIIVPRCVILASIDPFVPFVETTCICAV